MEQETLTSLLQMPPAIEWWATGLAVIYIVLAARNSSWCWPFAFVSSCLWAWQVWFAYDLLFDAGLNIFYAVMAIWGARRWWKNEEGVSEVLMSNLSVQQNGLFIGFGVSISLLLGYLATTFTAAAMTYLDALTTVFSVMATFMLIERKVESWIYLLAMDLIYIYLYFQRGSLIFAGLFVVYCVLAIVGFFNWRKIKHAQMLTR